MIDTALKYIRKIREQEGPISDNKLLYEIGKLSSQLVGDENEEYNQLARKLIINVLDNWHKIPEDYKKIFTDLIETCGFYPYLEKEKDLLNFDNLRGEIKKQLHKSQYVKDKNGNDLYFHSAQKKISDLLLYSDENLVVSAPTSFGKSLLIEEIIASAKYKNIVIIQPTLALLNETRNKLKKYEEKYKLIIRTSQDISEVKGNLFLLTAERVMEYPNLPKIDFFILDEFYKISKSRDDERYEILNKACNLLLNKHESRFYFLGPPVKSFSNEFTELYNVTSIDYSNYNIVEVEEDILLKDEKNEFRVRADIDLKKERLFEELDIRNNEQTIIYCRAPDVSIGLAVEYMRKVTSRTDSMQTIEIPVIEWLKDNISENWNLNDCLQNGIGIHNGTFPKHVNASIIKYFNDGKLKYLFCTSTIIEGVNTSAKNVIVFENLKAQFPIDKFDKTNIKGRAGRLMEHYVGNFYTFSEKLKEEKVDIDVPFVDQDNISPDILSHLDKDFVKNKETPEYKFIQSLDKSELELFKSNGVSIEGQKNIFDYIDNNIHNLYSLLNWSNYPESPQLKFLIECCWEDLLKGGEKIRPVYTPTRLNALTLNYMHTKSIKDMINDEYNYLLSFKQGKNSYPFPRLESLISRTIKKQKIYKRDSEIYQIAILNILDTSRHWFNYKLPKWLTTMHNVQEFICKKHCLKPGNYILLANQLENGFTKPNLSILLELGIPNSAINKISKVINCDLSEELIISEIKSHKREILNLNNLIQYERDRLSEEIF